MKKYVGWALLVAVAGIALAIPAASSRALAETGGDSGIAAVKTPGKPLYGKWGVDLTAMDRTVRPGDDFAMYAFGKWYRTAEIPADRQTIGSRADMERRVQQQLLATIKESARAPSNANQRLIGTFYDALMDTDRLEKLDSSPLAADLAEIAKLQTKEQLAGLMGRSQNSFGMAFFQPSVGSDYNDPTKTILRLQQSGLGIRTRDTYLEPKFAADKAGYENYAARTLGMIKWPDPGQSAKDIVALETRIAEVSWTQADSMNLSKIYNEMTIADLEAFAPGFPWKPYLVHSGLGEIDHALVFQKSAFPKIAAIFAETPLPTLKAWMAFHVADKASPYLSSRFDDAHFAFWGKLQGLTARPPRELRALELLNNDLPDPVGQEFVARYFPPSSKAKIDGMVTLLKKAMRNRILQLGWMSPSTKKEALEKLAALRVAIGYPDHWRDYSKLSLERGDLYGSVKKATDYQWQREAIRLSRPVDRSEWLIRAQDVGAQSLGSRRLMTFGAGILQPPFFDPDADLAVNFGGIGAVIGHEISHFFDDQGRKVDSRGVLRDWWTPADAAQFESRAAALVRQFDGYEQFPGEHLSGKGTLSENIADLAGVEIALDAYHLALGGKRAPLLNGFTGDQRFFLAYAQDWRAKSKPEFERQMKGDMHSPSLITIRGTTRNVDRWYSSFGAKPGDRYYLKPAERVRIW